MTQALALVHDYVTQRGGAERVLLSMLKAFPDAPLYTSLYNAEGTYPAFETADVRPSSLNRFGALRRHHRWALPLLAPTFSRMTVDAEVAVCSSSGWAHGATVRGHKVVYCHTPARWLYQSDRYLTTGDSGRRVALSALRPYLLGWDRRAAATASRYLANSTAVRKRIEDLYGVRAEVLAPPHTIDPSGPRRPVNGLEPGFFLCAGRLMPYKNVAAVVRAFERLPDHRLVVSGSGPEEQRLRAMAGSNVTLVGLVADEQLRWLYANAHAVVAASYEDFGLTPLEGAAFAKPAAVLAWGGFLDTVVEGETGLFFADLDPEVVAATVGAVAGRRWDEERIVAQAEGFGEERFVARLREIVAEEGGSSSRNGP